MDKEKEKLSKRIRKKAVTFLTIAGISIGGSECAGGIPEYKVDAKSGVPYTEFYYNKKENNLNKRYRDYYEILSTENNLTTFKETFLNDDGSVDIAVPQGICHIDKYTIITAYNGNKKYKLQNIILGDGSEEEEKLEDSLSSDDSAMLIVLNNENNEERRLKLPDANHVGGIATDGKKLYIAKSDDYEVSVIDYENFKKCIEENKNEIDYDGVFKCENLASYITYDDNKLWIGTWKNSNVLDYVTKLCGYEINGDKLEKVNEYTIPQNSNGACFINRYNQKLLMLSISNGRYMDSILVAYRINQDKNILEKLGQIVAPSLSETMDVVGDEMNLLFESGSLLYKKTTKHPIEGYTKLNIDKMFEKILEQKELNHGQSMKQIYKIDKYIEDPRKEESDEDEKSDDDEKEK